MSVVVNDHIIDLIVDIDEATASIACIGEVFLKKSDFLGLK